MGYFIIVAVAALLLGGVAGYSIFRYVLKGQYNELMEAAEKEAQVLKEKKELQVKEKFLNKKAELENIDYQLKEAFNGEVVIDGYKEHERAFIISPTTAKADRKAMYKDRRGYKKIVDGEEYLVDLIDGPNGTFKAFNKKEIKNIKKLKKQM